MKLTLGVIAEKQSRGVSRVKRERSSENCVACDGIEIDVVTSFTLTA